MKKILFFAMFFLVPFFAAVAQEKSDIKGIEAYYFHNTRRCMTCNTVEKVTKESLKELYGDRIVLKSLEFEDKKNKALVDKYKIEGQSLFFIKGDKKVDITADAFMNAVRRPEKLKEKIRDTVESLK
ncbi:MAG: nitrophenyl compound nitroreductase subunit ArsF family protein [Bacteroidota bacterium]